MNKKTSFTCLLLLFIAFQATSQTQIIAHRGYWKTDGSAQNSITALMKADSLDIYGSEMDIWLSSDGIPVVNHDADVQLDGKKIIVQDTPAATLRSVKLANGEPLPTLEEYLEAFEKCKNVKLIIEFKSHRTKAQEDELTEKAIAMVREKGLQDRVEYIAFGINFVNQVRRIDPQAKVYYLNGDLTPDALHEIGAAGIDYHYNVLSKNPQWVASSHDYGMKVNAWTVNKAEDIRQMINLKLDYITTDEPVLVRQLINEAR